MSTSKDKDSAPPRQASPARSFRTRMGTMLRRNSSGFGFSRPTTPFRSESKSSLRLSTDAPAPSSDPHVPSPVQETAEGEQPTPVPAGPSTLSKEVTASPEAAAVPLTTEPESAPQAPAQEESKNDVAAQTSPASEPTQTEVAKPAEEAQSTPDVQPPAPAPVEPTPEIKPSVPEERRADTFAFSDPIDIKPTVTEEPSEQHVPSAPEPEPTPVLTAEPEPISEPTAEVHAEPAPEPHVEALSESPGFPWRDDTQYRTVTPKRSSSSVGAPVSPPQIMASPESIVRSISPKPSRSSVSSYGHVVVETRGRRVSVSLDPQNQDSDGEPRRGRSRSSHRSHVRVAIDSDRYSDPFADPPTMPVPNTRVLSPIDSVAEPIDTPRDIEAPPQPQVITEEHTYSGMPGPVFMPLPPAETVIGSQKQVREFPSAYSLQDRAHEDTDHTRPEAVYSERSPLLRSTDHNAGTSKSAGNAITFPSAQPLWPTIAHSLQSLGWTEYLLPDSSVYYYHKEMRITTDIDLRKQNKLQSITEYLDRKLPEEVALAPEGWELWIRDAETSKQGFSPVRSWVNHKAKALSFDPPPSPAGEADTSPDHTTDDDRLDKEYRYWAFVEGHPAHVELQETAHTEAMDALTWSYTDCLLPANQTIAPPFLPQECQELMGLLRSFENSPKANSVVHTRIVARVLLRVAQWRQQNFRPDRPLPRDVSKGPLRPERRLAFRRTVLDVIMSILCLGIPYLFMNRSRGHRIDEESGLQSAGPILMIGACACLVSAVILSASVTFLTLPGLDDVARLAGMIAILFSASSMVSSVVALFRYKADIERTVVYVGGEGLMLLSRRSIVMSLPLVFLAWAIAAFVTGITFYSFRGATITGRAVLRAPFEDYTHWAVVGSLGGLAGVLAMTALLARR